MSLRIIFLGSVSLLAAPAFAATAPAPAAAAVDLAAAMEDAAAAGDDIIVTGIQDRYTTPDTSTATKTRTPLKDVPQSISVVTKAQIDDQAIRSIADLVRLVPGASAGQGEGNRDQITLRGNNTTADFFLDGLRDDVQYFRSFYNLDRVEVLKGPNAMIFGRGGGGGVVNRVTKTPVAGSNALVAAGSVDTFGDWTASADANLALGGEAAFRVNGFYEALDNHRDHFDGSRYAINPVIGTTLGATRLLLGYEHVRDDRVVDRGIPSENGRPLVGFRDTFFGQPGFNDTDLEANVLTARAETKLSDSLTANAQLLYGDYNKSYANAFAATPVTTTAGVRSVGFGAYRDLTSRENFIAQANLEWRGTTGSIGHVVLFGGDFSRQITGSERQNGIFSNGTATPLTDPVIAPAFAIGAGPATSGNRSTRSSLTQGSVYVQDQISIGHHVDVIAGIRYDRFELDVVDRFGGPAFVRNDNLWSPRFGLVLKPVAQTSLYASYTRSFLPQSGDQFTSLNVTTAALEPERFDNYEVGVKWDIRPNLSATAAIYQLDRTNTRAAGPVAGTTVLSGAQRSRGFELGITGQITRDWQATLGYGYTDAKIVETTVNAPAGRRVGQVPRHQFSLWNRYQIVDRLGVGLGVYHQSDQFASISNGVTVPGYTRLDAALFVKLTERIDAQVNVENLTNTTYFPVAHNDNNISTSAPINARFTIRTRF